MAESPAPKKKSRKVETAPNRYPGLGENLLKRITESENPLKRSEIAALFPAVHVAAIYYHLTQMRKKRIIVYSEATKTYTVAPPSHRRKDTAEPGAQLALVDTPASPARAIVARRAGSHAAEVVVDDIVRDRVSSIVARLEDAHKSDMLFLRRLLG